MTDQPPARRAWFKRKDFGGGATPATWEGWACTAGFVVLLFAGLG